jgi:hypothetical protein
MEVSGQRYPREGAHDIQLRRMVGRSGSSVVERGPATGNLTPFVQPGFEITSVSVLK